MNYLLDTHAFLWTIFESGRLSNRAKKLILNPENSIYISLITFWEISLKYSLGKLELENILPEELPTVSREAGFATLPLSENEVSSFHNLPRSTHKDPFDRLIIWQAINNDFILISKDRRLSEYQESGLRITW
ncbi:MAG: type II toxin-antitoxin system VapC family toxin [Candidatus Aminicenantes bacterium]|jgi:PIN domain nuclease of toxin-antitoxin system